MKTIKFYTLGCKVNQYETQAIREKFLRNGYSETTNNKIADTYIINTCTVTQKADLGSLSIIRKAKKENPKAVIIATGCLTELDKDRIKQISDSIKIIKNKDKFKISQSSISDFKGHARGFLKIQDGCENHCSYCKVPLVRGHSKSKPLTEVLKEARTLVGNGFKEIVLTGICLGAYGRDLNPKISLAGVISGLEEISALLRIRLSSIEARDISDELIRALSLSKKFCRHLHIPLQSGDDTILKKMNRNYTSKEYFELIKKIKKAVPGISITTDVMVGFPGESESNFKNTIDLIKKTLPLKVHIFPYSKRENTFAAKNFLDQINPVVVKERVFRLKDVSIGCGRDYQKGFYDHTMDVLIEGSSKECFRFWEGHTDNYIKVLVKSKKDLSNKIVPVKLNKENIISD